MKNKLPWLFLYLILSTLLATSLGLSVSGDLVTFAPPNAEGLNILNTLWFVLDLLKVFWLMISFQIAGLPAILVVILFYVPMMVIIIYIISVLRGTD
jgi:hypothetical protein